MPTIEIKPDRIDVEFSADCDVCGSSMNDQIDVIQNSVKGTVHLRIGPCLKCLKDQKEKC